MPSRPRFSIVIPTRNRADTLRYALATCLEQDFDDYEIVVCDNGDPDATRQVVEAPRSPRIRYLAPGRPLAMSANWERGVNEALGEYVTVLGDDDGLMPYALRELDQMIARTGMKAIRWHRGIYTWPTIGIPGEANLLQFPLSRRQVEVDGRTEIAKVMRFESGADSLPMIYCSVIHHDLIDRHRQATGRVFLNNNPDVYSSFSFGYLAGTYLSVSVPMNIAGLSHASNGVANLMKIRRNATAEEFERLNIEDGYLPHPLVPDKINLGPVHVVDSFLHAKDALFPHDDSLVLDRKAITERYLAAIVETDPEERAAVRQCIRASLADSTDLLQWFDTQAPFPPPGLPFRFRPARMGFDGNVMTLDAAPYGVTQVHGAVKLVAGLLGVESSPISYELPSVADVAAHLHSVQQASAQAAKETAAQRDEAALALSVLRQQMTLDLEEQRRNAELAANEAAMRLDAARAEGALLQHQLGEAHLQASLRYVPRRLIRKVLGILR